ncbi:MAG: hypothetical protein HY289_15685 [Planctomycetes bacterium]|nr:hypothetical protein [Planctomycetota bacterium]
MITNDAELAVVQEQRSLAEGALASLRRDLLPKNRQNYEIFAEAYIEQIKRLRNEIDCYLGLSASPLENEIPVVPPENGASVRLPASVGS